MSARGRGIRHSGALLRLIFVATVVLIIVLTTEVGARILYRAWMGGGLDLATLKEARVRLASVRDVKKTEVRDNSNYLSHPYRAYVYSRPAHGDALCAWNTEAVLSFGGSAAREFSPDRMVVGLFGDSIAFELGLSSSSLLKKLQEAPAFRGKEVRLVNAATLSGRMPMQFYTLSYLLASGYHFDVVVNLDGFNELNPARDANIIYPIIWAHLFPSLDDLGRYDLLAKARIVETTRQRLAQRMNDSLFGRNSAVVNLLWSVVDRRLGWRSYSLDQELHSRAGGMDELREYITAGPRNEAAERDPSQLKNEMIRMWLEGSSMMGRLAHSRGARYVHILQPNPYWPDGKVLSAEEARLYNGKLRGVDWIPDGYRQVLAQQREAVDPTPIFRDVRETVYKDEVGHMTALGNDLLADHVVREVARRFSSAPPKP